MTEEESLMKIFKQETGKNAIWRNKVTKGYLAWKEKRFKKKPSKSSPGLTPKVPQLSHINSTLNQIIAQFQDFQIRLAKLESAVFSPKAQKSSQQISSDHFLRIIRTAYNSSEKKMGEFVKISTLTSKIKDYIPWSTQKIHHEIYKLFTEYKIDLQPGKGGNPLVADGKKFVWFKLK